MKQAWDNYIKLPQFLLISKREVQKILDSYPKSIALDLGAGHGTIAKYLQGKGFKVVAVDNNEKMIAECLEQGIDCRLMNAEKTGFGDKTFDLVITDGLLEHYKDCSPILQEEQRISRKNILNFVPKDSLVNVFLEKIQRVPKEYRRPEEEWLSLHKKYFKTVQIIELKRLLAIKCEI